MTRYCRSQLIAEHKRTNCKVCFLRGEAGQTIDSFTDDEDNLARLAASLETYATCKAALDKTQGVTDERVPPEYTNLAKNCCAASFSSSHFAECGTYR